MQSSNFTLISNDPGAMMDSPQPNYDHINMIVYRIEQLEKKMTAYLEAALSERQDMAVRITRLEEKHKFLERALGVATLVAAGAGAGHIPAFL